MVCRRTKTDFTECFYVYIGNIYYYNYKNTLIILSFGLSLLNLQIIAIVMQMKRINRLKIVLAEQDKTGKWLAHALDKNESTVSRWCTNEVQLSVETLLTIAETLKVDIKEEGLKKLLLKYLLNIDMEKEARDNDNIILRKMKRVKEKFRKKEKKEANNK